MEIDWSKIPERFHYWKEMLDKYGGRRFIRLDRPLEFTSEQIRELAIFYNQLRETDLESFGRWLQSNTEETRSLQSSIAAFFGRFGELSYRGISPFTLGDIRIDVAVSLDWSKLPTELSYARWPAEKYGRYQFESQVDSFLENASEAELNEVREFDRTVSEKDHLKAFREWVHKFPMTEHPESALVYFLFGLCQHLKDWEANEG